VDIVTSLGASCVTTIPRIIFDAVVFKHDRNIAKYDKIFCQFKHSVEQSPSSSSSEEEDASLLVELEYLSLIFKLLLRRTNQTEHTDRHQKPQGFENDALHSRRESVIKPNKNFLLSNQYNDITELLSEPLVQSHCQCHEEKCNKILTEKEKANFQMTAEDQIRMNKDTVHICSFLGLKLDFFDCLKKMPPNIREHRTLCDWVLIFLQDNYNSLGFTDKDSLLTNNCLNKMLLDSIL